MRTGHARPHPYHAPNPPLKARGHYIAGLSSGLRNDIDDDKLAMRQVRVPCHARQVPCLFVCAYKRTEALCLQTCSNQHWEFE